MTCRRWWINTALTLADEKHSLLCEWTQFIKKKKNKKKNWLSIWFFIIINISAVKLFGGVQRKYIIIAWGQRDLSRKRQNTQKYPSRHPMFFPTCWRGYCGWKYGGGKNRERDLLSCIEVHPKRASISQEPRADLSDSQKCHWRFKAKKSSRI